MIQHELFQGTKWEIGYVGNQGRHIREISPFNVAMPEGYVVPLIGGGTATLDQRHHHGRTSRVDSSRESH